MTHDKVRYNYRTEIFVKREFNFYVANATLVALESLVILIGNQNSIAFF